ncbi:MAG: cytochrome c biogenesis protein [Armatimonadetes bacterium]|nr:cytochrome c biogenesis protein [Armatimonadota bacterium]
MATDTPASVASPHPAAPTFPAPFRWLLFAWMCGVIVLAFFVVPNAQGLGPLTPILYFHVPMAWNGGVGLILSAVYSFLYLKNRRIADDAKAMAAAELGLLYCVLATITGSIWARGAWGLWWNWDPKQSSIVMLILIYGAYFALRSSVESRPTRATLSAAYALLAVITVPLLMYILPYYLKGLHPYPVVGASERGESMMDSRMRMLLFGSALGFLGLYVWMFRMRVAVGRMEDRREGLE